MERDIIALRDEGLGGEPLLIEVMKDGKRYGPQPKLLDMRERLAVDLTMLPQNTKALHAPERVTVDISSKLVALRDRVAAQLT